MLDLLGTAPLPDDEKPMSCCWRSQSLIKAVEARMDKDNNAIDRATRQGYIMTPFFADQLPTFENQQQSMRFYAENMINTIDLKAETARLSTVKFDAAPLQRKAKTVVVAGPELSPAGKTLEKAENLYAEACYYTDQSAGSKDSLLKIARAEGRACRARASLVRAGADCDSGKARAIAACVQKTLESSPDDFTQGWTNIYLGRLSKAGGDDSPWRRNITRTHWPSTVHQTRRNKPLERVTGTFQKSGETNTMRRIAILARQYVRRFAGVQPDSARTGPGASRRRGSRTVKGPHPKSPEENTALVALFKATDPDAQAKLSEEFLKTYADTDYKAQVLQMQAQAYHAKKDDTQGHCGG